MNSPLLVAPCACGEQAIDSGVVMKETGVVQGQLETDQIVDSAAVLAVEAAPELVQGDDVVSFQAEMPLPLHQAMADFIERCPNWDQYRLVQAALAGFLVQNGADSRELTRLYVGNMFRRDSLRHGV